MSGSNTIRMISAYNQMAAPTLHFSGFFQSPPQNFHNTEDVEIDIVRSDEDIAIVVQDLSTGYRDNTTDIFTNKRFKPPIYKEKVPINSFDLLNRMPGDNPFENPDFRANLIVRMFNGMTKIEGKIRRSMELQASQVLQTGTVTLSDENGVALYTIDYKPKATHFPTASITWGTGTEDKMADINALAEVIRNDGLADPNELHFGVDAFESFIKDADVLTRLDTRRMELARVVPMEMRGKGGIFRGTVEIGNYKYDMWTYGGRFKDPQTSVKTPYLDPAKVIVRDGQARLDATFGAIPNIGALIGAQNTALNVLPELPGRLSNAGGGMDLFTNAWLTADGEQLFGGVGARPLMIPTAIDTYGCLDTGL